MRMNSFSTGLIAGAVIGSAVGTLMNNKKATRTIKHTTDGIFKNIGSMVDSMISN